MGTMKPFRILLHVVACTVLSSHAVMMEPIAAQAKEVSIVSEWKLLHSFSDQTQRLQPQTIRPPQGYLGHSYLVPAGYYQQMWDWDGYFIGVHLANQKRANAVYLKWWAMNFADSSDRQGYVAGCITPNGPRPLFGKFAMKPFLAQGAYFAAEQLGDYSWIAPIWSSLQRVIAYREKTQLDRKTGLYFWENAMQSGADNNAALTNDPRDEGAILGVDISTFQLREYLAMALIANHLDRKHEAHEYRKKAAILRAAILSELWSEKDDMFWNRRRDNGTWVRVVSYSNFVPLMQGLLPRDKGRRMIERYLLNPDVMRSPYGIRSLSKQDPAYNNIAEIKPYSNWRGPIWINANYMDWIALRRYGFPQQAHELAVSLAMILQRDIRQWGSMHEDYDAETGKGLAPTPEESPNHRFAGFVGWDMLGEDMLQCEVTGKHCMMLEVPDIHTKG